MTRDLRLFVYGSLMKGERAHSLLADAELIGPIRTLPVYLLADLGVYPALVANGAVSVAGELYLVDKKQRFAIDVKMECPALFQRIVVKLEDGTTAETYAMREEQVRGRRRIAGGDWRKRFEPRARPDRAGPVVQAARARFKS